MATSTYLKIITLNVNKQIAPVKRHRMTEWLKKKKYMTHLSAATMDSPQT